MQTETQEGGRATPAIAGQSKVDRPSSNSASQSGKSRQVVGEVLLLKADLIRQSIEANRIESAYSSEEFANFKDIIAAAGGNTIPISVRFLANAEHGYEFENVTGHRRLRACRELGFPVRAVVEEECDDGKAFVHRLLENSGRVDLSPFELGAQIAEGLKKERLRSIRHAASITGRDPSDLAKAVQIAGLDPLIVAAFREPSDLQYKHGKPLCDAVKADPVAVLTEAKRIAQLSERPSAHEVVAMLVKAAGGGVGRSHTRVQAMPIEIDGQPVGRISVGKEGKVSIEIEMPLERRDRDALVKALQAFIRRRTAKSSVSSTNATVDQGEAK